MIKTHYDNLQVSRNANEKVIKAAYKSLIQEYHPDRQQNNVKEMEKATKLINEAYRILSNSHLRSEHDAWIQEQNCDSSSFTYKSSDEEKSPSVSVEDNMVNIYAAPWKRIIAVLIDLFISIPLGFVVGLLLGPYIVENAIDQKHLESQFNGLGFLVWWMYFSVFECSRYQATIGKLILQIKVTDMNTNRIGFWKASGRHWSKIVSTLIFLIGFIMVFFTKKRQGLHDIMAGCLIINKHT